MTTIGKFFDKEIVEVELQTDKKTGLFYRPGSSDQEMIRDCMDRDYKNIQCKDQVVLDLGANIGGFLLRAASEGAKHVIAYEPEPNNFEMLKLNTEQLKTRFPNCTFTIFNQAVYNKRGTMQLMVKPGGHGSCSASIERKARKDLLAIDIEVVPFSEILEQYKPTFIKIDVEGAEYAILEGGIPPYVKHLAFELHGFSKDHSVKMFEMWKQLSDQTVINPWNIVYHNQKTVFNSVCLMMGYLTRS